MQATKFIILNIIIANVLQQGVDYLTIKDIENFSEEIIEPLENVLVETITTKPELSWFLPYVLVLQLSVVCLFMHTLRKFKFAGGRAWLILIGLVSADFLFTCMDVLQFSLYTNYAIDLFSPTSASYCHVFSYLMDVFQHLSVGLHLMLCAEVSGILPRKFMSCTGCLILTSIIGNSVFLPFSFDKVDATRISESCTINRNMNIAKNYTHRVSSLHLLPSIIMACMFIHERTRKKMPSDTSKKLLAGSGDEGALAVNISKFTGRSMACHYAISILYCLLTLGIKTGQLEVLQFIHQLDTPENMLRKCGYLHHTANTICLLVCLNLDDIPRDETLMEDFGDVSSRQVVLSALEDDVD